MAILRLFSIQDNCDADSLRQGGGRFTWNHHRLLWRGETDGESGSNQTGQYPILSIDDER